MRPEDFTPFDVCNQQNPREHSLLDSAFASYIDQATSLDIISSQCGGQSCHMNVEFADRVTWIARIRLDDSLLKPPNIQAHVFLSEVATFGFLAHT